jgi:predicted nicotinamide N-methyase
MPNASRPFTGGLQSTACARAGLLLLENADLAQSQLPPPAQSWLRQVSAYIRQRAPKQLIVSGLDGTFGAHAWASGRAARAGLRLKCNRSPFMRLRSALPQKRARA